MAASGMRTARFLAAWLTGRPGSTALEVSVPVEGGTVPGTLVLPRSGHPPFPAWIALHGITRPGRFHESLVRFASALAASGAAVLVPEVPAWIELELAPDRTAPTVRGALDALDAHPAVAPGPRGLIGFSFGAPQAIRMAADSDLSPSIAGVGAFGGYQDLRRTIEFLFSGHHEWEGEVHRRRPDPYGRWIVVANYLTGVAGHAEAADVADGLRTLARVAGDLQLAAWHSDFDVLKRELRAGVAPGRRELFDRFAPPAARDPFTGEGWPGDWPALLADAARRASPEVELPETVKPACPVHVIHGKGDHLIPYTEALRLARTLESDRRCRTTITALFGHSRGDPWPRGMEGIREGVAFVRALSGMLGLV